MLPASPLSKSMYQGSIVRVLITGANGHLGRRLIARLAPGVQVTATVRSAAARRVLEQSGRRCADRRTRLPRRARAGRGGRRLRLRGAPRRHPEGDGEEPVCRCARARRPTYWWPRPPRTRLRRIVYLSILGSDPRSQNAALASKGRAERACSSSAPAGVVLRVPMVLGEDDHAARALRRKARGGIGVSVARCQPGTTDLRGRRRRSDRSRRSNAPGLERVAIDLAGPESLSREALVQRAAATIGRRARCISLPLGAVAGRCVDCATRDGESADYGGDARCARSRRLHRPGRRRRAIGYPAHQPR